MTITSSSSSKRSRKSLSPADDNKKKKKKGKQQKLEHDDDDEEEQQELEDEETFTSPLTASLISGDGDGISKKKKKQKSKKKTKRERKQEQEALEEQQLTSLLFGGSSGSIGVTYDDDVNNDDDNNAIATVSDTSSSSNKKKKKKKKKAIQEEKDSLFTIDRTGEEDNDDEEDDDEDIYNHNELGATNNDTMDYDDDDDDDDDDQNTGNDNGAWVDDDDDQLRVNIADSNNRTSSSTMSRRVKKLQLSRNEENAHALKGNEFERRLRQRYETTTQLTAHTNWARVKKDTKKSLKKQTDDDDNDNLSITTDEKRKKVLLSTTSGSLLLTKSKLQSSILQMKRCPDINLSEPNQATIQSVQFHPGSIDTESPLVLTAGLDKTLRFFQIDTNNNNESTKIHGIHFPKLPIYTASFLGDTGSVVVSGRRSFFYIYNAVTGNIDHVPQIYGFNNNSSGSTATSSNNKHKQQSNIKSLEKHVVSPNGKIIAFIANNGYIVLVDSTTKHWIGNLKCNGSVRALSFTSDSNILFASGSDGDIYRWDVNSRRCIERFSNNDGTITSSLATSNHHLAVGAESGVVNLYSDHNNKYYYHQQQQNQLSKERQIYSIHNYKNHLDTNSSNNDYSSSSSSPQLLKSIMNLHTTADNIQFNHDGQLLAISTRRDKSRGLKIVHVPTQTVFSNWPTSKTPLSYVWSMDFSPQSQFLAIGNDKGKCLLYQLEHYS